VRGPGDSFGEMALVADGVSRSATVAALEEAETFAVYGEYVEAGCNGFVVNLGHASRARGAHSALRARDRTAPARLRPGA